MAKIRILGDGVINRIAAGEVIQRPASVVKELIENSLDAGARKIDVEISRGGKGLIRVTDDGEGMDEEDLLLAIERHATSKVEEGTQIFGASSLGFRGEALPAIASISVITIETCAEPDGGGNRLRATGGTIRSVEPVPRSRGTTIEVRRLFFNTPARRKFMKSDTAEAAQVREVLTAAILTHPDVAFVYRCDDRRILVSPGDGNVGHAVARVFGTKDGERMVILERREHPNLPFAISGALSAGLASRSTSSSIVLSVNGRVFRSAAINRTIQRVYSPFLAPNRWPIAVVFIEADPRIVDVNVHPAKLEVRFSFFSKLSSFLGEMVGDTIHRAVPEVVLPGGGEHEIQNTEIQNTEIQNQEIQIREEVQNPLFERILYPPPTSSPSLARDGVSSRPRTRDEQSPDFFTVLGQIFDTYIVAVTQEGLVLVDQHAAHERVIYEQVVEGEFEAGERIQRLLLPQTIDLAPDELALLKERSLDIARMGLELTFSERAATVEAVPSLFEGRDLCQLVRDLIDGFREQVALRQTDDRRAAIAAMVACKAAIKANHRLTSQEMRSLLRSLYACEHPTRCPHGRPTIVEMTPAQLEKTFGRT